MPHCIHNLVERSRLARRSEEAPRKLVAQEHNRVFIAFLSACSQSHLPERLWAFRASDPLTLIHHRMFKKKSRTMPA
jgi:hypothetical protein